MPKTWAGRSCFEYEGSIVKGTKIFFGHDNPPIIVSALQYNNLRKYFLNRIVPIGTSRTNPPLHSIGDWLMEYVSRTAIASYVGPILILEGYARREGAHDICIIK
jgi:hypothetical protein